VEEDGLLDRIRGLARRGVHWQHYEKAYLLLAGLATGLVLSVHSVVSFDFARPWCPDGT